MIDRHPPPLPSSPLGIAFLRKKRPLANRRLQQSAVRAQNAERGVGDSSQTVSIWGTSSSSTGTSPGKDGSGTKEALTQRGFEILVKLIEELQFEKELEQDKGVGLVPGPVCVI